MAAGYKAGKGYALIAPRAPKPVIKAGPGSRPSPQPARGPGFRVRIRRIADTDKTVLPSALYLQMGPVGTDFTVEETAEHIEYRTIGSGEFSAPAPGRGEGARSLRSTSFTTLTINWDAPWLVNHDITPAEMRSELYSILRLRTPFELLVTRSLPEHGGSAHELLMKATLRGIVKSVRRGEADTRYYDLSFREWRKAEVGRRGARGRARKKSKAAGASKNTNGRHRGR